MCGSLVLLSPYVDCSTLLTHELATQANPGGRTVGDQMSQRRAQRYEQCDARKSVTGKGLLFRTRFIAEYAEHLSDADAIADLAERPDDYFQSLWLESLLANRLGHPPPHPWFIEFCLRYITDDIDGLFPQAESKPELGAMFAS